MMKTSLTVLFFILSVARFNQLNAQVTFIVPTVGYNFYSSYQIDEFDNYHINTPGLNYGLMVQKYVSYKSWYRIGVNYMKYTSEFDGIDYDYGYYSLDNGGVSRYNVIDDIKCNYEGNIYALNYDGGYILGNKEIDDKSYSYTGYGIKIEYGNANRLLTSASATPSQLAEINQKYNKDYPIESATIITVKLGLMYGYQYSFNRHVSAFAELHAKTFFLLSNEVGINAGLRIRP